MRRLLTRLDSVWKKVAWFTIHKSESGTVPSLAEKGHEAQSLREQIILDTVKKHNITTEGLWLEKSNEKRKHASVNN